MIWVVPGVAIGVILVLAYVIARLVDTLDTRETAMAEEREAWRDERAELLERIQRPERIPTARRARRRDGETRERPKDLPALARIGTVTPLRDGEGGGADGDAA